MNDVDLPDYYTFYVLPLIGACAKLLEFAPGYSPAAVASVLIDNSAYNKLSNIGSGSPNILLYQWY